jgi:hypothetical protein
VSLRCPLYDPLWWTQSVCCCISVMSFESQNFTSAQRLQVTPGTCYVCCSSCTDTCACFIFCWLLTFMPFAIFGHLVVSLGTGAFVRLEFLGPWSRTQWFSKISELFFFQKKHNGFGKKPKHYFVHKKHCESTFFEKALGRGTIEASKPLEANRNNMNKGKN